MSVDLAGGLCCLDLDLRVCGLPALLLAGSVLLPSASAGQLNQSAPPFPAAQLPACPAPLPAALFVHTICVTGLDSKRAALRGVRWWFLDTEGGTEGKPGGAAGWLQPLSEASTASGVLSNGVWQAGMAPCAELPCAALCRGAPAHAPAALPVPHLACSMPCQPGRPATLPTTAVAPARGGGGAVLLCSAALAGPATRSGPRAIPRLNLADSSSSCRARYSSATPAAPVVAGDIPNWQELPCQSRTGCGPIA